MKHYFLLIGVILALATGCTQHHRSEEPEKTQLEIREFQTRTFEVGDHALVMKSILNVLQDDGYMVKNASSDLGFLSAIKEVGLETPGTQLASMGFGFGFSTGRGMGMRSRFPAMEDRPYPTHQSIEVTVNVSDFGEDKVRVRASFQSKLYDNHEAVMRVQQIANVQFYQDFFAKVDKGLFLQQQNI